MNTATHHHSQVTQPHLGDSVYNAIKSELRNASGKRNLYQKLLNVVEPPLLELLMEHTGFNQSKTAQLLGLSRSTTRKKLEFYFGEKYFPQVGDINFETEDE